jgi:hypothetical protein
MELDTITIDPAEAKTRLAEYREALKTRRNAEDLAMARAYAVAAKGAPIIKLSETIAAGGYHPNGLPRLAVARANTAECFVRYYLAWDETAQRSDQFREIRYSDQPWPNHRHDVSVGLHKVSVVVPMPAEKARRTEGSAMVPPIPPRFRPKRTRLGAFHVLWEVEEWKLTPPRDPALIRHIGGDVWAVHAVWDLTDLERAVLTGGRR